MASTALKELDNIEIDYAVVSPVRSKYDYDEEFIKTIKDNLYSEQNELVYDAIFSFNYFPDLSRVALECGVKYISWVYDSPHYTLESLTLNNRCNYVFVFDYALYSRYAERGISSVYYMPLPARIVQFSADCGAKRYEHNISFLGNLYDGEQDQYGQINTLPDYLAGYIEACIAAQQRVYGADIIKELISDEMYESVSQYIHADLGKDYNCVGKEIFLNILRRRTTMNERIEILKMLGELREDECFQKELNEGYLIDLYCGKKHHELPVRNLGFADYENEMLQVFYSSKINLNITLKSIQTGIPLRVMDILGAGGFCMTNYQAELDEYFKNGIDIVWYESVEDLKEKCRYYLTHDDEREEIARNGQRRVKELFSYSVQFGKIFEIVGK